MGIGSTAVSNVRIGGVEINYYFICKRKLWLYSHQLGQEQSSDMVQLGSLLHEESYPRKSKNLLIDDLINLDILEDSNTISEVKYSRKQEEAHKYQILYYLYYLKNLGISGLKGSINYPRQRRRMEVILDPESETCLKEAINQISRIKLSNTSPEQSFIPICKKCSYLELCWG